MRTYKPKILERDITMQIRNYLKFKKIFHFKAWQGPMSTKGVPDIVGVLPGGTALYIEVKTEKGKLSDAQREFLTEAKLNGAMTIVARKLEDVSAIIK